MILKICEVFMVLRVAAALGAAPPPRECADLSAKYADRYRMELELLGRRTRPLALHGRETRLAVWAGGAAGEPAAAAAALLHAALRHGLGYEPALEPRRFDLCTANLSELAVAPAAARRRCAGAEEALRVERVVSGGAARVHAPGVARATLTLRAFRQMKPPLPPCESSVTECAAAAPAASDAVLAAAPAPVNQLALDELRRALCACNSSLSLVLFGDASCFRETLRHLQDANSSFLFIDDDLKTFAPELVRTLKGAGAGAAGKRCPIIALDDGTYRVGDGAVMRTYAPQIADVVERFCPTLSDLREVSREGEVGGDLEAAACGWASRNDDAFGSWIAVAKRAYALFVYLCAGDALNDEYAKAINAVQYDGRHDFAFEVYSVLVECLDRRNVTDTFDEIAKMNEYGVEREPRLLGAVVWSSSAGVGDVGRLAERYRVPLALVGPVVPGAAAGPTVAALDGSLREVADAHRALLRDCGWSRVAVLSDESPYAESFAGALFREGGLVHVKKKIAPQDSRDALASLRDDGARVIIVNSNSSLAAEVLLAARALGMTPPLYAWIVREWSPDGRAASERWGPMEHFSVSAAWRGTGEGATADGDAQTRARLDALWPDAAWPALAAPLADALLLFNRSFTIYRGLYSSSPSEMRHGGYAVNFSQIYHKVSVAGVARQLRFRNGSAEGATPRLERWRGGVRVAGGGALGAGRCPVRVRDRPRCSFAAGGAAFAQRCHDAQIYSLLAALALLPLVFALARRARLRRLLVRDLNLLAHVAEAARLAPVVHGDLLCLHREIGRGNFGRVYLGTLRRPRGAPVAVAAKTPRDRSGEDELLREAATLQRLDHENVVKFLGICVSNGSPAILMEYAQLGDLLQWLRARRREASAAALSRLAREAAAALRYLAGAALVHRDVRAANCLLDERGTLKLADFGLARRLSEDSEYTCVRRALFPVLWMAPESLSLGTFSAASDVWALGVLCLELVTLGRRPYGASAPLRVLAHVRGGGRPPLPPDASPETMSLLTACWQHKASERPSAADVERYLARQPQALRPALLSAPPLDPPLVIAPEPLNPPPIAPQPLDSPPIVAQPLNPSLIAPQLLNPPANPIAD